MSPWAQTRIDEKSRHERSEECLQRCQHRRVTPSANADARHAVDVRRARRDDRRDQRPLARVRGHASPRDPVVSRAPDRTRRVAPVRVGASYVVTVAGWLVGRDRDARPAASASRSTGDQSRLLQHRLVRRLVERSRRRTDADPAGSRRPTTSALPHSISKYPFVAIGRLIPPARELEPESPIRRRLRELVEHVGTSPG